MRNDSSNSAEDTPASTDPPAAEASPGETAAGQTSPGYGATGTKTVRRTRTAGTWVGLVLGALILILLLIFILQNSENQKVNILFWDFSLPLGVSMLFAAIAGALIMALVGGARILQLRKAYRRKPPRP